MSGPVSGAALRHWSPLVVLLALVAAAALAVELGRGYIDLDVYRFGGRAVLDGLDLYAADDPATGLPFTYPPFAALLMVVPAALPLGLVAVLWAVAGVAALAATIALFLAEAGDRATPARVAALTALALPFEPVWQSLSFGQVNLFLLLLISVDLLRPDRRWAGVLVGVAAGIKLTPLVFVVLLLLAGRRTAAGRAALAFAGTVVLGLVLLPASATAYWTDVLWDPSRVGGVAFASNQSVNGVLARLLDGEAPTLVWMAVAGPLALAVLVLAAWWWRRGARDLGLCLGAMSMLLASPISWSHHWVWAVPTALVLLRLAGRPAAAAWTLLFVSGCFWWPPHRDGREYAWSAADQVVGNAYVWASLLLALWALWATRRVRTHRARPPGSSSRPTTVDPARLDAGALPQAHGPREAGGPRQGGVGADPVRDPAQG